MKTFLDSMLNIEALRPSSTEFTYLQRGKWYYDVMLKLYRDFGILKQNDMLLSTSTNSFDITSASTQIQYANVQKVYVTSTQTTATSNASPSQDWDEYKFTEIMDKVNPNYITFPSVFPDKVVMRVQYLAYPALVPATSTDSTTIPDIDQEALNAVEYGTLSRICKAGDAPDVQLANAYEMDFNQEVRRLKAALRLRTRKMLNDKVSYREWEW